MSKIEVTESYLKQVLEVVYEMKNKGTYEDKWNCEKVIKNTKRYLNRLDLK